LATSNTLENENDGCGIISNHGYTVISVYEIDGLRLLKLRNPWGKDRIEWTGAFSYDSALWTPKLIAATGMIKLDDGVFFLPFDEYFKRYECTSICYVSEYDIHS
jgi:calpain-15